MHTGSSARPAGRLWPSVLGWTFLLVAVAGASALLRPVDARAQAIPPQDGDAVPAAANSGRFLYNRDCASCHGVAGRGTAAGIDLQGKGAAGVSLALTSGRMPLPANITAGPKPYDVEARQVPRGHVAYRQDQIDAIVAYSRTIIDGPDVPSLNPATADLSHGEQLYQNNCAACHTWSGRGGALTSGRIAPNLAPASGQEVIEAMRTGIGTMPQFSRGLIDDAEANDLAAYVTYLDSPANPGGAGLAYLGPVAEGFVAWLVGIVGLLLAVRWIGSRQ